MASGGSGGIRAVFAASVRREREARGWTLAELARRAGIGRATAWNVEAGRKGPSLETAGLIAGAFGLKPGALTDGEAGDE